METLTQQARGLSSGTIASLIGNNLYSAIDEEQFSFVAFCEENEDNFRTWQAAWKAYAVVNEWPFPAINKKWEAGDRSWRETSLRIFNKMLGAVPPAVHTSAGFAAGEATTHSASGAIHSMFIRLGKRYFCRLAPLYTFDALQYRAEIVRQFPELA